MSAINRDTFVACVLLLVCGVFWVSSFDIEDPGYVSLSAEVWPRVVLVPLTLFCLLYLVRSATAGASRGGAETPDGLGGWISRNRNPLWCFVLFGLFLVTLPWLGMLIGGILFVFGLFTAIGERSLRHHLIHGAVAIGTVGAMWALFTFALHVILPEGVLFSVM